MWDSPLGAANSLDEAAVPYPVAMARPALSFTIICLVPLLINGILESVTGPNSFLGGSCQPLPGNVFVVA